MLLDVEDSEDYIASIVIQQTWMFPNASFPAAFSLVLSMEHLAKYRDSSGSTLLHHLLNTSSNIKPRFWMNRINTFDIARTLLEHGVDLTSCND